MEKYEIRDALRDIIGELKRYEVSLDTNAVERHRAFDFDSNDDEQRADFDHVKVSYLPPLSSTNDDYNNDAESDAFSGTFRLTPDYTFGMLLEDALSLMHI